MDAATHVAKDAQNLSLVEALLQARVEKVDQSAPRTALHQDKDLPAVALQVRRRGLDKVHDRRVPVQQSMVRDLCTHGGERVLVPDAHVLQDECRGRLAARQLHRLVGLYKIDMRKAALTQKALHRHDMLANLDARPRHKPPLPLERRHGSTCIGHGPCPSPVLTQLFSFMPKSRRDWSGSRRARHDPLRRGTTAVSEVKAEVVPVLEKLPGGPSDVPTGEKVWALASISSLLEEEHGARNRRLLLSRNIVARVLYELEHDTNLEVRREASGALRNLCVEGDSDIFGELVNKGGLEIVLQCLRWATMGLQNQERQMERAKAPAREARERLLSKPVEQMNRKERRHAAKLAAGTMHEGALTDNPEFAPDASAAVDVRGWAADAPASLAAMDPPAAQCLVEMCESLVTILGCICETSEKLLVRAVRWDWQQSLLDDTQHAERQAFAGDALAAWLCEAVSLGVHGLQATSPYSAALVSFGTASANTLCALCDDAKHGLGRAVAGLPTHLPPTSKKARRREQAPVVLPTPSELGAARAEGSRRLALLAQAVALLPTDGAAGANAASLATMASGVLCNVQRAAHAPEALGPDAAPIVVAQHGPLGKYMIHEVLARLTHLLSLTDAEAFVGQSQGEALQTSELALEIVAEMMSVLGRGEEDVEQLSITHLPLDDDDDDDEMELMEEFDDDAMDDEPEAIARGDAEPHALDRWVFSEVLRTPLLGVLLRLAAPSDASERQDRQGAQRRAVELRALAAANNFLLRLALFAPPPPSQWPGDEETLERIALWREWVGTAFLEDSDAEATPVGSALHEAWAHVFRIAAHWAAVPSVVDAETLEEALPSAMAPPTSANAAHDGLAIVDTCLGCLWSIARILEGQLPLVQDHATAPYITALMAAYQSARLSAVRIKSLGTLAVLARSQAYRQDGAASPPDAYLQVYAQLGGFFVDAAATLAHGDVAHVDILAAAINAVMDTYANELAPWDIVYRQGQLQEKLAQLVAPAAALVKRIDRRANVPLYAAAHESVQNLRAFLEYRASV